MNTANELSMNLQARAQGLVEELRTRSTEIDDTRHLPQDIAEKMAAQGFYRLITPVELGGLGASPRMMCEVCEILATANGSAAWCVFIGSTSQYLFGALSEKQRQRMLKNPNVITSGVFGDSGTAQFEERDGHRGYIINGHWRFGSGCRNAAWISGGIHEVTANGELVQRKAPLNRVFFEPEEIQFLDNWHVSGLKGTGSCDYTAEDVWVEEARMSTTIEYTKWVNEPIYQFPRFGLLSIPCGAIGLGMAQACLDEIISLAKEQTPTGSRRTLAMRATLHRDLATHEVALRAARTLFYQTIDEAWENAQIEREALEWRMKLRTANIHAVSTALATIDRMYTVAGGSSIYAPSCLQQHFRDMHVVSQHMMVAEPVMELAGRVLLGLDQTAPGL
ncbi:MAG: acyl-CoA dehydrogenase family protein [Pseudomonadota bacterium]|nr:acyl-CoA dehydrogenase family protein [Pseudomonadota bacterium]